MNDEPIESADDALEATRDDSLYHLETDTPALSGDGESPASPASDNELNHMPIDHPETDSNIDQHEAYDAGTDTASSATAQHEAQQMLEDESLDNSS